MKYCTPTMRSFSKDDIRKNIVASATCVQAVCGAGTSFTCGVGSNYVHRTPDEICEPNRYEITVKIPKKQ